METQNFHIRPLATDVVGKHTEFNGHEHEQPLPHRLVASVRPPYVRFITVAGVTIEHSHTIGAARDWQALGVGPGPTPAWLVASV